MQIQVDGELRVGFSKVPFTAVFALLPLWDAEEVRPAAFVERALRHLNMTPNRREELKQVDCRHLCPVLVS